MVTALFLMQVQNLITFSACQDTLESKFSTNTRLVPASSFETSFRILSNSKLSFVSSLYSPNSSFSSAFIDDTGDEKRMQRSMGIVTTLGVFSTLVNLILLSPHLIGMNACVDTRITKRSFNIIIYCWSCCRVQLVYAQKKNNQTTCISFFVIYIGYTIRNKIKYFLYI